MQWKESWTCSQILELDEARVSQPHHCWHFGLVNYLSWGLSYVFIVEGLTASLASPTGCQYQSPPVTTIKNVPRHRQMFSGGKNHPWLKTTALNIWARAWSDYITPLSLFFSLSWVWLISRDRQWFWMCFVVYPRMSLCVYIRTYIKFSVCTPK